jgi:hypothetical protein
MTSPLLETPPRVGRWPAPEVLRIEQALAKVTHAWVPLYRTRLYGGARLKTWQSRGYEARHHQGYVEVRLATRPRFADLRCCCGTHRGELLTVEEYMEDHG